MSGKFVTLITAIFVQIVGLSVFVRPSYAAVRCETQYGGQVCVTTGQLQINKKVWDPTSRQYVDNLSIADRHFVAGEQVLFSIKIQNSGDATLNNVMFTDTLPSFLMLVSGNLSENLGNLTPGQTIDRVLTTKVNGAALPLTQAIVCPANIARVTASDNQSDQDSSQFCIENRVKGTTTIPSTGPEMLTYPLLSALGIGGFYIRKLRAFK